METLDVMDWRNLVFKIANKYTSARQGQRIPEEDLIQAGMLGLVLAKKAWLASDQKLTFMSYGMVQVRNEVQKLLFSDVGSSTIRNKEAPVSPEIAMLLLEDSQKDRGDLAGGWLLVHDFIDSLPIDDRERRLFRNTVEHGKDEATRMYMDETGMSRMGAYLRRKQTIEVARQCYLT
jgi:hypothetical protein